MFDLSGIRAYFQRAAAERVAMKARDALFEEAMTAMDAGNVAKVAEIAASTGFSYRQTNAMVIKAINSDNVEMFQAVLNGKGFDGDMNEKLHFYSPLIPEGPHHSSQKSMLYIAISNQKTNVAVWLAENPETDVTQSGSWETSVYRSGGFMGSGHVERKGDNYAGPLELARELGMTEVIIPLARRTAQLRQNEAAALLNEARGLAPA